MRMPKCRHRAARSSRCRIQIEQVAAADPTGLDAVLAKGPLLADRVRAKLLHEIVVQALGEPPITRKRENETEPEMKDIESSRVAVFG